MTHDTETPLKPCPFCGGDTLFWGQVRDGKSLSCKTCGVGFTQFYGRDDIKERLARLWNTRAAMQPTVADMEAALIAAKELADAVDFVNEGGGQTATSQLMACLNKFRALAWEDKA